MTAPVALAKGVCQNGRGLMSDSRVGAPTVEDFCQRLAEFAPLTLAESWDNVGLLVGDRRGAAGRVMTCLTITPAVVAEALRERAALIVAHHPLPFQPLKRWTTDTTPGRLLWELVGGGVAIYSAHTAFDSAAQGINQQWAERLGLHDVAPLSEPAAEPPNDAPLFGPGRMGRLVEECNLRALASRAVGACGAATARVVGNPQQRIGKVALACGSGGSFLEAACRRGCDALVTGEANFHTCLEAEASGVGLVLAGHYGSERFAMEWLADRLAEAFPAAEIWASRDETDPLWQVGESG